MRRLFAFAITAASTLAQGDPQKIDPRWFLPRDHERLAVVDFAALRATDFWACLQPEVLQALVGRLELGTEAALARVDRMTWVGVPTKPSSTEADAVGGEVVVLEGNGPLGDPATDCADWDTERLGDFAFYWLGEVRPELRSWPKPELFVRGSSRVLRPLLQGPRQPGLPCPDVMSLSAGRERPLAFVVGKVTEHDGLLLLVDLLPAAKWPAGRAPTYLALRLAFVPDPEDEDERRVVLHVVVRHAAADAGVAETEAAVRGRIDGLLADRRLKLLHAMLRAIAVERDGIDLHVRIDCGREREAAALASLALSTGRLVSLFQRGVDRRGFQPPGIWDLPGAEFEAEGGGR